MRVALSSHLRRESHTLALGREPWHHSNQNRESRESHKWDNNSSNNNKRNKTPESRGDKPCKMSPVRGANSPCRMRSLRVLCVRASTTMLVGKCGSISRIMAQQENVSTVWASTTPRRPSPNWPWCPGIFIRGKATCSPKWETTWCSSLRDMSNSCRDFSMCWIWVSCRIPAVQFSLVTQRKSPPIR